MLKDDLHAQKKVIESLAFQHGARRIRLFGSVALGAERLDSDVDFLVDFPVGYDMFTQRLALAEQLELLVGRKVDLIPEHELNPHIRSAILGLAVEL